MAVGARSFAVRRDAAGNATRVHINDTSGKAADVGLYTWGASATLANELWQIPVDLSRGEEGRPVLLELGAGTGLVGIAAAMLWAAEVVLTDLPAVVPNLAQNVALNGEALTLAGGRATAGSLDWETPRALAMHGGESEGAALRAGGARVILAADVLYSEELPALLVAAIEAWLEEGPAARVVLAYPLRVFMLDIIRDLWARMEAAGFEAVQEGRAETSDEFDDEKMQEWSVWRRRC